MSRIMETFARGQIEAMPIDTDRNPFEGNPDYQITRHNGNGLMTPLRGDDRFCFASEDVLGVSGYLFEFCLYVPKYNGDDRRKTYRQLLAELENTPFTILNASVLQYFRNNTEVIPDQLKPYRVFFPETRFLTVGYKNLEKVENIPFLYYDGENWCRAFWPIDYPVNKNDAIAIMA